VSIDLVDVVYILGVAGFGFRPFCCFLFKYTNGSSKVDYLQKKKHNECFYQESYYSFHRLLLHDSSILHLSLSSH